MGPTVRGIHEGTSTVCLQRGRWLGHIATSRRVFTSADDKPAEEERGETAAE